MIDRVAIVTGGAGGIGLETARGLARAGLRVIVAGRDDAKGAAAVASINAGNAGNAGGERAHAWRLDLASLASVRDFAARAIAELPRVDVLVCNAGVWPRSRRTTRDGFELCLGTNHLGHMALALALEPTLRASAPARIVVVSSGLHVRGRMAWDDLMYERHRFDGTAVYAQSKLANLLFTFELARRLAGSRVTANACHPGVIKTGLAREYPEMLRTLIGPLLVSPEKGARPSLHLALAPELATVTGRYFDKLEPKKPAPAALDRVAQARLWDMSERLLAARR